MSTIRQGQPDDLDAVRRIQSSALAEPWPELVETAVGGYPPLYVVTDPEPIAYAIFIPGPETVAYLPEIAVSPGRTREGHGSRLLDHICTEAAEDGYQRLRLSVLASDRDARAFYSAQGFEQVERLPEEFERGDGVLLERTLD